MGMKRRKIIGGRKSDPAGKRNGGDEFARYLGRGFRPKIVEGTRGKNNWKSPPMSGIKEGKIVARTHRQEEKQGRDAV